VPVIRSACCLATTQRKGHTAVDGLAVFFALGLAVLAFGLAAALFFAAGVFLVVGLALLAVFLGAAFFVTVVDGAAFGLASLASFYIMVSNGITSGGASCGHEP
jgi:hypothetical protein